MTVDEVMEMSIHEFRYWQASEVLDGPLGGARLDHMAALIAKVFADVMSGEQNPLRNFLYEWDLEEEIEKRTEQLQAEFAENAADFDVPDEDDEEVDGDGD